MDKKSLIDLLDHIADDVQDAYSDLCEINNTTLHPDALGKLSHAVDRLNSIIDQLEANKEVLSCL